MCCVLYDLGIGVAGGLIAAGITSFFTYSVARPKVVRITGELNENNHLRFKKLVEENMYHGFYLDITLEKELDARFKESGMLFFAELQFDFSQCDDYSNRNARDAVKKIDKCFYCECEGPQNEIMAYRFLELPKVFFGKKFKRVTKTI